MAVQILYTNAEGRELERGYQLVALERRDGPIYLKGSAEQELQMGPGGCLSPDEVNRMKKEIGDFIAGRTYQIVCSVAIGVYPIGELSIDRGAAKKKVLVVPAKYKSLARVNAANGGHRLVRKPEEVPGSIDEVQSLFVPQKKNKLDFHHPSLVKAVAGKRVEKIALGMKQYFVLLIPNYSDIFPRIEICILAWTNPRYIRDYYSAEMGEDNVVEWLRKTDDATLEIVGRNDPSGKFRFADKETCNVSQEKRSIPDELRQGEDLAEPVIGAALELT